MSDPKCPPRFHGTYKINAQIVTHLSPEEQGDICNPTKQEFTNQYTQCGRFFQQINTDRPNKLGVWEKVFLGNIFQGWRGHYVDTKDDSEFFYINVTKTKNNVVQEFELTATESGFNEGTQRPKVEWGVGKRIGN